MKTYKVAVGDKEYIVKVEEVTEEQAAQMPASSAPVQSAASNASQGEGEVIPAPIQGGVLRIPVKEGDTVRKGDTLLILEAMKLENEIVAPRDGVISAILVHQGDTVDADTPLLRLK